MIRFERILLKVSKILKRKNARVGKFLVENLVVDSLKFFKML